MTDYNDALCRLAPFLHPKLCIAGNFHNKNENDVGIGKEVSGILRTEMSETRRQSGRSTFGVVQGLV